MRISLKYLFVFFTSILLLKSEAQELNVRVSVLANRVGNNVNRNVFQTLQTSLNNFINNRKWTSETYGVNERLQCNLLLNLESTDEMNVYKASLSIQAARPVYNSSYNSPIINFIDENITFKYQEFQQLDFNENRVSGSDPLSSNLTAVFAYYAYMMLGFDASSFSPKGGEKYFQKALNIVNNAPDAPQITGWKAFDGIRNRYWLAENMMNSRYVAYYDVYYGYYRDVLDKMYEDERGARANMMSLLSKLDQFNTDNPNTMINQFFFQGKSNEIINILSKGNSADKSTARTILMKLDITNSAKYKDLLK